MIFGMFYDREYWATPLAHDVHQIPYRAGMRRHYLRVFGMRIASWVTT